MVQQQDAELFKLPNSLGDIPRDTTLGLAVEDALSKELKAVGLEFSAPYITLRRLGLSSLTQDTRDSDRELIIAAKNKKIYFKFYRVKKRIGIAIAKCDDYPEGKIIYHPISPDDSRIKLWHGEEQLSNMEIEPEDLIFRSKSRPFVLPSVGGEEAGEGEIWEGDSESSDAPLARRSRKAQSPIPVKSPRSSSRGSGMKRKLDKANLSQEGNSLKRRSLLSKRLSSFGTDQSTPSSQPSKSRIPNSSRGSQMRSSTTKNPNGPLVLVTGPRPKRDQLKLTTAPSNTSSPFATSQAANIPVSFKVDRSSDVARVRKWSICSTAEKLFAQALAAGLLSSSSDEAVLEVNIIGPNGEFEAVAVAKGDQDDYMTLLALVEEAMAAAGGGKVELEVFKL